MGTNFREQQERRNSVYRNVIRLLIMQLITIKWKIFCKFISIEIDIDGFSSGVEIKCVRSKLEDNLKR